MKRVLFNILLASLSLIIGILIAKMGAVPTNAKKTFVIEEPLLIEGEGQKTYSILPVGTTLYLDKSWPEGHSTFHVYFHFKGDLRPIPGQSNDVAPLWLRSLSRDELAKLTREYPLSRDELLALVRAKRATKQDLIQILRDWPEDEDL